MGAGSQGVGRDRGLSEGHLKNVRLPSQRPVFSVRDRGMELLMLIAVTETVMTRDRRKASRDGRARSGRGALSAARSCASAIAIALSGRVLPRQHDVDSRALVGYGHELHGRVE